MPEHTREAAAEIPGTRREHLELLPRPGLGSCHKASAVAQRRMCWVVRPPAVLANVVVINAGQVRVINSR